MTTLNPPNIAWTGTVPRNEAFDDTYFAQSDGRAETCHVFLDGNHLPARLRDRTRFTIAELGFGTGLNFLQTLATWQDLAAADADTELTYIAFECAPPRAADMTKALSAWPDLASSLTWLLQDWPPGPGSTQRAGPGFRLELIVGDANDGISGQDFVADAWYLDGFSPAKNPDIWSADLMRAVFRRTRPGGTFATYTAAGWVRRNLLAAGFQVEKTPGFGTKRDMLRGYRP